MAKGKKSKGKLYTSKAAALRSKDRQAGSNRIQKVKGGWKVYRS